MSIFNILIVVITHVLLMQTTHCQDWTWINGDNTAGAYSTHSSPGARSGSSTWKDANGVVWMFGGKGFSDVAQERPKLLNDLWTYDVKKNQWNLVHAGSVSKVASDNFQPSPRQLSAVCGVTNITLVIYGGLDANDNGVADTWVYFITKNQWLPLSRLSNYTAESSNESLVMPQARGDMASWCTYDSLYIYGGMNENNIIHNDMWKLLLRDLNWYEVQYSTIPNNTTYNLGRNGAATWFKENNTLYMFGGNTQSANIRNRHLNFGYSSDMWKFIVANDTWIYINGHRSGCQPANYGIQRKPSTSNHPGCRHHTAAWTDSNNQLWMYGGDGTDTSYPSIFHTARLLADLWYFNTKTNVWTWISGSKQGHAIPYYFMKNYASNLASPGGRYEAMYWLGPRNTFYLVGGLGHDGHGRDGYLNDVWLLDVDYLIADGKGFSASVVLLFIFLVTSLIFTMTGLYLYARDMRRPTIFNRFDSKVKYSKLTTNIDD